MSDLNFLQKVILRLLPFRLNQFFQTKIWKNGVYTGGMNEEQRSIAMRNFFASFPVCELPNYGPPFKPPWIVFPDYDMSSMGFRMGSGEDHALQFYNWYKSAAAFEIDAFKEKYPEIEKYSGYYAKIDKVRNEFRKKNDH